MLRFPAIVRLEVPKAKVNVPDVGAPIVQAEQTAELIVTVGEAPELASKITLSADVGTPAFPLPPEDAAQLVVVAASQVPEPPTQ
jgi:hypothetical protein